MSDIQIKYQGQGEYLLIGELSFTTVSEAWSRGEIKFDETADITLDLQGVERTDSAGLAFLVEWMRSAYRLKKTIRLKNMPRQMLALAKVSGLDEILPLDTPS